MATWIQYPQWVLLYLCVHVHIYTKAGFLGIKLGTVIRDRAGVIKINTLLASCKQTSAFPSELPRMRLWEHTWCAKSSLFIPTSRGNQEQAQSQNYRSDIWISDLSPHSAPGIGLVSSIVWDISVTSEISTNPTFVPLERRKCGCHGNWQGWGSLLLEMNKLWLPFTASCEQIIRTPLSTDSESPCNSTGPTMMGYYMCLWYSPIPSKCQKKKRYAPAHPSVWEKEHQVETNQGNWVPNVKVTSSQWTYSSSCVIWVTLGRLALRDGSWFPTLWSK